MHLSPRFARFTLALAAVALLAAPAQAQYRPKPIEEPPTGEAYHIEASAAYWFPTADITVASAGSGALTGINGTQISAPAGVRATPERSRG